MHCPEAALPTVSLLGIVRSGGGQLNNGPTLLHYDLETNVYDLPNKASVAFTVSIYFRNGNRWTKFPILARQSRIFITGRIFGITTNAPRLAISVDDVYFIPNLSSITTAPVTPISPVGKQKQTDRWNNRANPITPIKRPRILTSNSDSQPQDDDAQTCLSSKAHIPARYAALIASSSACLHLLYCNAIPFITTLALSWYVLFLPLLLPLLFSFAVPACYLIGFVLPMDVR
jgi:hypothetical protein